MSTPVVPRLHHLALTVTDVEASLPWYSDVFGVSLVLEAPHPGGVGMVLTDSNRALTIVLHRHDTNDNAADFSVSASPSPRASNH